MPIVVKDLSFAYGKGTPFEKKALDGVSLTIEDGEFLGIMGHTGSGKSTFIQHLNGLIKVQSGEIDVNGIKLTPAKRPKPDLKALRAAVGMVFQYPEYQLFDDTVIKDVAFGPKNMGFKREEAEEMARQALRLVGLDPDEVGQKAPFELSGGQKRRAAIAGVIVMKPKILVLDEPTAGLDPYGKEQILDLVLRLKEECSPTVIVISHDMDEITRYASRLVVFGEALSKHLPVYEGVSYTAFIVPGLIMMSVLQNAFANTASSLIQAKIAGHLVFVLMPAIPGPQMAAAYIGASFVRSFLVGAGLYIVCAWWAMPPVREPFLLIAFAFFGAAIMASLGLITALWAEKYDQMGAVQNFVVMPLTFLSGVFYSVDSLPPAWREISRFNPFFYLVDGFRQGFFGRGDTDPWASLAVAGLTALVITTVAVTLLTSGWKIRH